ncbi:MAG: hypothetical protein PG981_000359 [Wolbachia endosymbiont of Ctenocephalides orientis wCori]|nr:MAG: hypothetical protein PG981_000359 [Wolbachia endosymbiont of Ctenocephalides orientis wCori]
MLSFLTPSQSSYLADYNNLDSKFNITISYDNANSAFYTLKDSTEIKVGRKNLYAVQNSNKSIGEIINNYPPIANRLEMYIFVQSLLNNETATIGHGNRDVLHNNPYCKSHLVGNGGENIFVITSGYKTLDESKLPIPEVVIYDIDSENLIDTLDLCQIKQQIVNDLSREIKVKTEVEGKDLLLLMYYDQVDDISEILSRTTRHDVVCIRLKNTLITNWHERLLVILNNAPMKIEEFDLRPLPLVFGEDKKIIVITSRDIEEKSKLVIPKKAGNYIFARSENDLVITNAFNRNLTNNEFCTISFNGFYQEPKMETLSIKFIDKEILLKNEMEKIDSASALTEQSSQYRNATYNSIFNFTTNTSRAERKRRNENGIKGDDQAPFHAQNDTMFSIKNNQVTSGANKPSSWVNDLAGWIKGSVGQWFNQQAAEMRFFMLKIMLVLACLQQRVKLKIET